MPTYDYECGACGHAFELFQSITDQPIRKCPSCGRSKARRLIGTGGGIIFKGSGFYQTDYRSESYKKQAKAETEAATGPADKSKTKSESSSAAKTEPKSDAGPTKPKGGKSGGKNTEAA